MAVSKEGMMASYVFQFAILLAIMTNLTQYFYYTPPQKSLYNNENDQSSITKTWTSYLWNVMTSPTLLMVLATIFISIGPLKNLCFNICLGVFQGGHGFDPIIGYVLDISFHPIFSTTNLQYYTVLAYCLMAVATAKQTNMVEKLVFTINSKLKQKSRENKMKKYFNNSSANLGCNNDEEKTNYSEKYGSFVHEDYEVENMVDVEECAT